MKMPCLLVTMLWAATQVVCLAETERMECSRGHGLVWAAADSAEYLKYAPDRVIDILHFKLEVTPNFKERTVAGTVTVRFKPIAQALAELRLDGVDLRVN